MTIDLDALKMLAHSAVLAGATAENVPSPCVSVCRMDTQKEFCEGCLRSIDEIRGWRASSDLEKKVVWARIGQRVATLTAAAITDCATSTPL